MSRGTVRRAVTAVLLVAVAVVGMPSGGATSTTAAEGFDSCGGVTTSGMRSIAASTYRSVNVYIGGSNLNPGCAHLTSSWVATVAGAGFTLIPTYVGAQASCTTSSKSDLLSNSTSASATRGTADADDAVSDMAALGLGPPNIVYGDMEAYDPHDAACAASVAAYLDAFIAELHAQHYRAGVYGSTASTVAQLVTAYNNTARQRPDDIWIARNDGVDSTADASVPSTYWLHHRIRQYQFNATLTLSSDLGQANPAIDKDRLDGDTAVPSAEPLPPYAVSGTATTGFVRERSTPSTSGTDMAHDPEGTVLSIVCQTTGSVVAGDSVWDQLSDGNYVSDLYTTSPGGLGFAGTLPRCDAKGTARITAPANSASVVSGLPFTAHLDFPQDIDAALLQTSTDNGTTWRTVGALGATTAGNQAFTVTAPAPVGTSLRLRASVTVNGTVYGAVNAPTVRVVGPVATMAVPPAGTTASAYTFQWSGADGASRVPSYDIRYRHAYFSGNFSPWASLHTTVTSKTLGLAEGYDYCMQVRARSVAGDVGAWSPARCIARVLDDKALGYSSGWTRRAGSSFYDGSALVTTAAGRTLTRTGAVVERIGVLATTCSTCGKVGVYVGGTLVGSVNLAASSTHYRTLLYVSRFSLRSGSVVLKTLTSNKLVQVDGLLLSRT